MAEVSIIVPVYKVEKYLDACVESVANQTFTDLEIILVDDGSPDACPQKCDAWAKKDPRVRVIHQQNGGLSAARNTGIDAATSPFLLFVDSDDTLAPDTVRRCVRAQQDYNADVVYFNLLYVDENDAPIGWPDFSGFQDECLTEAEIWDRYFMLKEQQVYYAVACNKLYRASLFDDVRFAVSKRYEDQFLMPYILERSVKNVCLGYAGYRYRQRGGSIMSQGTSRNYLDYSEFLLEWTAYFARRGDMLRAEGMLNDAIRNLAEKDRFDLSTPAQRQRYRTDCRGCADSYRALAKATGQRSMLLRAALLRLGLPVYLNFLKHKS